MAEFAPHYNLYKIIDRLRKGSDVLFWFIFSFSIFPLIVEKLPENTFIQVFNCNRIVDFVGILNIIFIVFYFIVEVVVELILVPLADRKRRDDFIDNAFGSTFSLKPSIGYYDTEEVSPGLYKAACNLFENCFFTYSLVKGAIYSKVFAPSLVAVSILVAGYYGFKQAPFALSLLQVFFSANVLGGLVKQCILLVRLDSILDSWVNLFQLEAFKLNPYNYCSNIYRLWLQYESLHSRVFPGISDGLFLKNKEKLDSEWVNLKTRYNIS